MTTDNHMLYRPGPPIDPADDGPEVILIKRLLPFHQRLLRTENAHIQEAEAAFCKKIQSQEKS